MSVDPLLTGPSRHTQLEEGLAYKKYRAVHQAASPVRTWPKGDLNFSKHSATVEPQPLAAWPACKPAAAARQTAGLIPVPPATSPERGLTCLKRSVPGDSFRDLQPCEAWPGRPAWEPDPADHKAAPWPRAGDDGNDSQVPDDTWPLGRSTQEADRKVQELVRDHWKKSRGNGGGKV